METIIGDQREDTSVIGDFIADGSDYDEENIMNFTDSGLSSMVPIQQLRQVMK
jgi:hypothetical protein